MRSPPALATISDRLRIVCRSFARWNLATLNSGISIGGYNLLGLKGWFLGPDVADTGVLALFYRGRTFPEHLYFAVLFQSFVFLVLALESVTAFVGTLVALAVGQAVQAVVTYWGVRAGARSPTAGVERKPS